MARKGIILAGGLGTRLYPMTKVISKQLLPIYDKPLVYYPLSVLMLAKIREILIISTPEATPLYKALLGDGSQLGIEICYKVQDKPNGLAEAFIIGEEFIGDDSVCLILGDNFFHGQALQKMLIEATEKEGATIFGYPVKNPEDFGVVEFSEDGKVLSLEEKPKNPKSKYAIPGLYFYDNDVIKIAKTIKPSARGEKEITAVNNEYLKMDRLNVKIFGRGLAWLDTGTPSGILKTSQYVEMVQSRQGLYISCIEEIAWRNGFISAQELLLLGKAISTTDYGKYIIELAKDELKN
jgi:glucose-1-phosphate thymidylyltransferase